MKQAKIISCLTLVVAVIMMSVGLVMESMIELEAKTIDMTDVAVSAINVKEGNKQKNVSKLSTKIDMETAPAAYLKIEKVFSEISTEEAVSALNDGTLKMEYSAVYSYSGLNKRIGAMYYNGHRETYYSERVLPGNGLRIPGRHAADDGTIRDEDGYIVVAADPGFLAKGTVLITSLGPAKVYDCGCAYGTVDIYVNW